MAGQLWVGRENVPLAKIAGEWVVALILAASSLTRPDERIFAGSKIAYE